MLLSPTLWLRQNPVRAGGLGIAAATVAIAAVLAWRLYAEQQRRDSLIRAVQHAGGSTSFLVPQTTNDRLLMLLARLEISGTRQYRDRCELLLNSQEFDDEWMRRHDQLRGLPVNGVIATQSKLSPEGVCRLVAEHQVQILTAPGIPLTDKHFERLAKQPNLRFLNLNNTEISDAAIALLDPGQLGSLYVGETQVTAAGLESLRNSRRLRALGLDGRQFSSVPDDLLDSLPSLRNLVLIGPDVTDDQLTRVARMPMIRLLYLERTSVTADGAARFRAQRRDCQLQMPPQGIGRPRRADSSSADARPFPIKASEARDAGG